MYFVFGKGMFGCKQSHFSAEDRLKHLLISIFQHHNISKDIYLPHIEKWIARANMKQYQDGVINQIFIPKNKVKDFVYISYPAGYNIQKDTNNIHDFLEKHKQKRYSNDFDIQANDQVRIISGAIQPTSDIKVFQYTTIPQDQQDSFVKLVTESVDDIFNKQCAIAWKKNLAATLATSLIVTGKLLFNLCTSYFGIKNSLFLANSTIAIASPFVGIGIPVIPVIAAINCFMNNNRNHALFGPEINKRFLEYASPDLQTILAESFY